MKVAPLLNIKGLSGKMGNLVYCYNKDTGTMYARRNVYPKITENNHRLGSVAKQLARLGCSNDYMEDLKRYVYFYGKERRPKLGNLVNSRSLLIKMMYVLAKEYPDIDLLTITKEYIYEHDLPVITIKRAVEANILQKVSNYLSMDHPM